MVFVEIEILRFLLSGTWAMDGNTVDGFFNEFLIMHIGAGHGSTNRYSATIDQHRTLDPDFATIGLVFPGFFPHPAAICSSRRRGFAIPSRSLGARHILPGQPAIMFGTRLRRPTFGSNHEWHCRNQTRAAWLSTGNLSRARKNCRWQPDASTTWANHLSCSWDKREATVLGDPKVHRESGETLTCKNRPQPKIGRAQV